MISSLYIQDCLQVGLRATPKVSWHPRQKGKHLILLRAQVVILGYYQTYATWQVGELRASNCQESWKSAVVRSCLRPEERSPSRESSSGEKLLRAGGPGRRQW